MNDRVWRLLSAAILAAGTAASFAFLVRTTDGQEIDHRVLSWFDPSFTRASGSVPLPLQIPAPVLFALALGLVVVIGAVRRLLPETVGAVALMGVTAAVAQGLKSGLDRPNLFTELHSTNNSFPSGHVTVAASSVFALLLVAPKPARWVLAPMGALWTVAVGVSTMVAGWHRPSDMIGGVLLAATAYAATTAFLVSPPVVAHDRRGPVNQGARSQESMLQ